MLYTNQLTSKVCLKVLLGVWLWQMLGTLLEKTLHQWGNTITVKCTISKVPNSVRGPPWGIALIHNWLIDVIRFVIYWFTRGEGGLLPIKNTLYLLTKL